MGDHRAEAKSRRCGKGPTGWQLEVPAPHLGGPKDGAPHLLAVVSNLNASYGISLSDHSVLFFSSQLLQFVIFSFSFFLICSPNSGG